MASKIHKNDNVIIITGKNKGKHGKIKKILTNGKAIITGVNLIKKHQKPIPALNKQGGIIEIESAIHLDNVAIFNLQTKKADKVKFITKNNKKIRIFKSTNEII